MNKIWITLVLLLLYTSLNAQQYTKPVFSFNGHGIEKFMANNLRAKDFYEATDYNEGVRFNDKPLIRVLVSFVINTNGEPDSLVFHESTSALLEKEVRRVIIRTRHHWIPATSKKGKAIISAPIFWRIYVCCTQCEKGEEILETHKNYFNNYPYQVLPNWRKGSELQEPYLLEVYPTRHQRTTR